MKWIYTKAPTFEDKFLIIRYHPNSYKRIMELAEKDVTYWIYANNTWARFKDNMGLLPDEMEITEEELDNLLVQMELEK